jgi:hypothetical protein
MRSPADAGKRKARIADAHADRVVILPTAYTHPEGSFYFSGYDFVLLQVGYAVSDTTQVSVTGTPPLGAFGEDTVFPLDVSLKTRIVDDRLVRVAAIGSLTGIIGLEQGNFFLGRVGGVVQLCFEESCSSSFNFGSGALLAGPATLMFTGAGGVFRVADWAQLLLEVDTLMPLGREIGRAHGIAVMPGIRFAWKSFGLDIAFVRALDIETNTPPIPLLVLTYRYVP